MRFEVRCKKEPQEVWILNVPMPLPGVSEGKVSSVQDRKRGAGYSMSNKEMQRRATVGCETWEKRERSQGMDPRTQESNSQGRGPKDP